MNLQPLGARLLLLNILRRSLVFERTDKDMLHRGQLPVLETALKKPGISQAELAAILCVTPASIAQSAKRLSKSGFIEKRVEPENKRRNHLYVTAAGQRAAEKTRAAFDRANEQTFAGFSEEEMTQLRSLLDRMIQNLGGAPEGYAPFLCRKEDPTQ